MDIISSIPERLPYCIFILPSNPFGFEFNKALYHCYVSDLIYQRKRANRIFCVSFKLSQCDFRIELNKVKIHSKRMSEYLLYQLFQLENEIWFDRDDEKCTSSFAVPFMLILFYSSVPWPSHVSQSWWTRALFGIYACSARSCSSLYFVLQLFYPFLVVSHIVYSRLKWHQFFQVINNNAFEFCQWHPKCYNMCRLHCSDQLPGRMVAFKIGFWTLSQCFQRRMIEKALYTICYSQISSRGLFPFQRQHLACSQDLSAHSLQRNIGPCTV